jgi:hypothetical protein
MKGLTKILLVIALFAPGFKAHAQPVVYGTVRDLDTQLVIGQLVEVYTDSTGTPYPFQASSYTNMYGQYSFTLPNNIPQGVIFKVKTISCSNPIVNSFLYPFNTIACDFTVCITNRYVSGTVYMGSVSMPASLGLANLIERHLDTTTNMYTAYKIDSLNLDSTGFYNFKLPLNTTDDYMVSAGISPADTLNYSHYLPAYYNNSALKWNDAAIVTTQQSATADIILPMASSLQGQGYISGVVISGNGDSLYKRLLILTTDTDVPVAFRYSNLNGTFSFGGLSTGTYKLFGDALGKQNPPLYFTISSTTSSFNTIIFHELPDIFYGSLWALSVHTQSSPAIAVYPNPVSDHLTIDGLDKIPGEKNIFLHGISGNLVYKTGVTNDNLQIPVSELTPGLYILQIQTASGNYLYKVGK